MQRIIVISGRVYYYMDDYENAESELKQAIDGDNTEALVLLGMVYIWIKETAQMQKQCFSSMYHRQKTEPKDLTDLHCVI